MRRVVYESPFWESIRDLGTPEEGQAFKILKSVSPQPLDSEESDELGLVHSAIRAPLKLDDLAAKGTEK